MTTTFTLRAQGPYSLDDAVAFLRAFPPATGSAASTAVGETMGASARGGGARLSMAFLADGTWTPVGVALAQDGDVVAGRVVGDVDVAAQTARILSLDVDARPWAALAARDDGVAKLQAAFPGARPVVFPSAYEAAIWGVLAQRVPMRSAAATKRKLAEAHGASVVVDGATLPVIPAPARLLQVDAFPGVPAEKMMRLHGIARAALDGVLDVDQLRALPVDAALARLETLRGIGAWTAEHVLYRGCGLVDALPLAEPRVLRGVAFAYGLPATPTTTEYARIAEAWRPFRMWACILVARLLARTPGWQGAEPRGRRRQKG